MTSKKNSLLKPAMIITLIAALNLLGISYGYWQDSLIGLLKAQTGYIDLRFEDGVKIEDESEEEGVFSEPSAKLEDDNKTIKVTGNIEKGKDGTLVIEYSVFNHGSLPVIFDKIQVKNLQKEGVTVTEPNQLGIDPGIGLSDSITIEIDAPKADETQGDDIESNIIEEDTSDAYEFGIVIPYSIESWKDELYIDVNIGVTHSDSAITAMLAPMPAMTFMPVEGEIAAGGLPEGPSDEELYGEGGTTEEADEPETVEGGSEQASEGNDGGESPGDEELYNTGGTTEEADEPETIEDGNEPESDSIDEEEGSNEESEEADGEEESVNQEQAGGDEATEEADEPEEAEDNSEPASEGDDEGESSDDQVQIDAGEGN